MIRRRLLPLAAALLLAAGCAYPYTPPALEPVTRPAPPAAAAAAPVGEDAPVTILVSIDGARPDDLARGVTPRLSALAAAGVSGAMRPSFPSKTFPNHWTLVTGVRPDRHGIVANTMEDPARPGETFTMATDDPFWWNAAEPIWVTAEKAGIRTATMFWPGSNVGWGGTRAAAWPNELTGATRPSDWTQFNAAVSDEQRVATVLDWMRRPAAIRPRLVTLYFDAVDTAGHRYGPADARTAAALAAVDARVGELVDGLAGLRVRANILVVSDHGMAPVSPARVIALDGILPAADARVMESGPYATLYPAPGREAAVAAALLRPHAHMRCWRREALPPRFHYGANRRIPPFLCLAEDGWTILKHGAAFSGAGNHGYDPDAADMRALFVAAGPAFRAGRTLPVFDNVAVAPLLRRLLGLPAAPGLDGTDRPFHDALAR